MIFNSVEFILFFPAVLLLYYILRVQKLRIWLIALSSFYFYMNWKPIFGLLLLSSIAITYVGALFISKVDNANRKLVVSITVLLNIASLIGFKYLNFIADSITGLLDVFGIGMRVSGLDIMLPIGISFYTFKAISYVVDVYKGKIFAEKSFVTFAAYMSFFPQILAGPIDRASNLIPQFHSFVKFNGCNISAGLKMMLWGYFLKVVFANRALIYVDAVYNNMNHHNGTTILIAAILYSIQIYADFAGYSLISIGCARAMGFSVPDNFNRPYFATSITEFWKRWHISLTKWLTEYVYFPLGGNRCSMLKNYLNIIIVFLVSGLWHGSAWNFVIWGGLHGVIQIVEKATGLAKRSCVNVIERISRTAITFFIATIAWIFFRLDNFLDGVNAVVRIFTDYGKPFADRDGMPALQFCCLAFLFIFFKEFSDEYFPRQFRLLENKRIWVRYLTYVGLSLMILACGVFDDSQFIYMQF